MSPALPNKEALSNVRKSGVRILVAAGSSGGHIFPALAFLESLKVRLPEAETLLILPEKNAVSRIQAGAQKVSYTCISPFKLRPGFKNVVGLYNFLKGSWQSLFIILSFRPDLVVGFGSLASVPAVLLAWFFRIRVVIHEQNVLPGQANRLLAIFADRIAVSFPKTQEYFSKYRNKTAVTGNPLRKEMVILDKNKALDFFGFHPEKFTVLVVGGSQGSSSINDAFIKAVSGSSLKDKLQVIHISGTQDYESIKQRYQGLGIEVRVFAFLKQMQYAYSASDLALSRAGATTIMELMFFQLPAIILPYPHAYQHQLANARILENAGCALIIEERRLDSDGLRLEMERLMNNRDRLESMRSAYGKLFIPGAADLLVDEALKAI